MEEKALSAHAQSRFNKRFKNIDRLSIPYLFL
jgi:hypothetical protein